MATPKGYTTELLLVDEMGDAWDDGMTYQFNTVLAQVEAYIDRFTGRSWLIPSAVNNELHTVTGRYLYLDHSPVTAVTSMAVRLASVGASYTTLTSGTNYELIDGPNGIVLLSGGGPPWGYDVVVNTTEIAGYILKVSYTTSTPVPADIEHAATLLVSDWLWGSRHTDRRGIKSSSVSTSGDQFSVAYSTDNVPAEVRRILNSHKAVVFA
jgi:hypothetical protein